MPTGLGEIQELIKDSGPVAAVVQQLCQELPAAASSNLMQAFSRFCTASIDLPVAWLEGFAAEQRAKTEARKIIQKTVADNIAQKINVPDAYADSAAIKFAQRAIGKQLNLDKTMAVTLETINSTSKEKISDHNKEVSIDWLNTFADEASKMSSTHMQILFGRVLAGEVINPGGFSIRTVKTLAEIDHDAAIAFSKLCQISMIWKKSNNIDEGFALYVTINSLKIPKEKVPTKNEIQLLIEHGLIHSEPQLPIRLSEAAADPNNIIDSRFIPKNNLDKFLHQGEIYNLQVIREPSDNHAVTGALHGLKLTKVGRELYTIVEQDTDNSFIECINNAIYKQGLNFIKLK